ncbi:unnamed protein product [Fusarium venenatum]|uniref:Uncharacterized protein n=1 Tax=Fusarium venenatum TaxID=56646 RepID=A0A2L2TLT8_9HYPO|nr:uncharacterized protein FVRRES_09260 [Fusarium venenatum]CEI69183.1 unnamed protein product [Fusarium venenatum]
MTKVFRQLGLWDDLENRLKSKKIRAKCEDLVSERMNKARHLRVSEVAFEYFTDLNIWRSLVNRDNKTPWPWVTSPLPSETGPSLAISQTYKTWQISRGKSIEKALERGDSAHQPTRMPLDKSQSPAGQNAAKPSTSPAVPARVQVNNCTSCRGTGRQVCTGCQGASHQVCTN